MTLGKVVRGNLKAMKLEASKVLAKARLGTDVAAQKRAAAGKVTVTLGELVPKYLDDRQPKLRPRYYTEIKRQLEKDWKPRHAMAVDAITRQNVVDTVDDIASGQGEVAADRARAALSGLYSWLIDRGYCETNATMNIRARAQNVGRSRVLSEAELVEVWRACLDDDYGYIIRLLILTAQRKTEVGDLSWPEIDFDKREIELPAERCKNGRTMLKNGIRSHVVPLAEGALAILRGIERDEGRDLVFGRGAGGFSGWSKAKRELDDRIAAARKKAGIKKPMPAWVVHDLRRSVTTHLVESRQRPRTGETYSFAQPHVAEAITNHISGHKSGVAGRYNKAAHR
jgi:integrase